MVVFAALTVIMIVSGVIKLPEAKRQQIQTVPSAATDHTTNLPSQQPPQRSPYPPTDLPPPYAP